MNKNVKKDRIFRKLLVFLNNETKDMDEIRVLSSTYLESKKRESENFLQICENLEMAGALGLGNFTVLFDFFPKERNRLAYDEIEKTKKIIEEINEADVEKQNTISTGADMISSGSDDVSLALKYTTTSSDEKRERGIQGSEGACAKVADLKSSTKTGIQGSEGACAKVADLKSSTKTEHYILPMKLRVQEVQPQERIEDIRKLLRDYLYSEVKKILAGDSENKTANLEMLKQNVKSLYELFKELSENGCEISDIGEGCVMLSFLVAGKNALNHLWGIYKSGKLLNMLQKTLVTDFLQARCRVDYVKLAIYISTKDYQDCLKAIEINEADVEKQNTISTGADMISSGSDDVSLALKYTTTSSDEKRERGIQGSEGACAKVADLKSSTKTGIQGSEGACAKVADLKSSTKTGIQGSEGACAKVADLKSSTKTEMACGFSNNDLSSALNKILDSYGLDEDTRRKLVECRKMKQLLLLWKNDLQPDGFRIILSGSYYEVTTVTGLSSDIDKMIVEHKIRVIDDISQWKPDRSVKTFMIDSDGCYKAFCKLYLMSDDYPGPEYQDDPTNTHTRLQNDDYGRMMLRNDARNFNLPFKFGKNGPAITLTSGNFVFNDFDYVFCLLCDSFPRQAANWKQRQTPLTRSRIGGAIIDQATHCYLVGVGNKGSVTEHLEWRLSFSHIENELIHAWNNTVNKCYIMMKFIKKDLIEPFVPNVLCSYHFKTILMWMNEEYDSDFFVPANLENCLVACLRNVFISVKNISLPHYFVEGCNLFNNKMNEEARDRLVSVLEIILSTWPNSLYHLKRKNLGTALHQSLYLGIRNDVLCDKFRKEMENSTDTFSLEISINGISMDFSYLKVTDQSKTPKEILSSLINLLNRSKCVTWHYQEESGEFITFMLKDALCQFGLYLIKRSHGMSNKQKYYYSKSGFGLIRTYINGCGIHTALRIAGHFTVSKKYHWALKVLEVAERKFDIQRNIMSRRSSEVNMFRRYRYENTLNLDQENIENMPGGLAYEVINMHVIKDIYRRSQQHNVMLCSVYLYHLQFICFNALRLRANHKVALDNMIWSSKKTTLNFAQKVNYNLIGHCYRVLGESRKAYREYRKSLAAWRNHNAALWQLAVLLNNIIQNNQH